uniref:Uncharacterized protein n=1 Tax=Opuntia streptacantha TaxID=393608 RepID=A0A7C8YCY4_OPUST
MPTCSSSDLGLAISDSLERTPQISKMTDNHREMHETSKDQHDEFEQKLTRAMYNLKMTRYNVQLKDDSISKKLLFLDSCLPVSDTCPVCQNVCASDTRQTRVW